MQRIADRVHGTVYLTDLASQIVHTQQFSRLDDIRQLGACSFVYPSATHTRREHSLGVYHLARTAVLHLQRLYPTIVSDDDVACVEVAGLIHDLGHGPFSHLFEVYMSHGWSHEEMGLAQFDILVRENKIDLQRYFESHLSENVAMIALLVKGLGRDEAWPAERVGRPSTKRFLTHIVHCRATGLDVDKLDYLARDALAVFGSNNVLSVDRIVNAMRATEEFSHIGFSSHVVHELVEVYQMRARLHERVYQHHAVVLVEDLLLDLMTALDDAAPRASFRRVAADPVAFSNLSDGHILRLSYGTDPLLEGAPQRAFDALHHHKRVRRIPISVVLRTQPYCAVCRFATEIRDSYCSNCGESTLTRNGILGEDGVFCTSESLITKEHATEQVERMVPRQSFRLHIVDVTCGTCTIVQDPHGYKWNNYELVKNIVFINKDGRQMSNAECASLLIPRVRRCRRVYCYVPECATEQDVSEITNAFGAWGVKVGELVE